MRLKRLTRIMLDCLADVRRDRRRVARALRDLRRSVWPRVHLQVLRRCERWLKTSLRTLDLAWECCVRSEEGLT